MLIWDKPMNIIRQANRNKEGTTQLPRTEGRSEHVRLYATGVANSDPEGLLAAKHPDHQQS